MSLNMIFLLLGGLGMFLYGMKMMSDGLEKVAGDRMRRVLEVLTTNRLAAVGVGTGVTALVQSSSATTVMVVGFVNAGLMTLLQATGVIMGANIGTTITAQLIAFNLSDVAPFILFAGMLMTVFVKKRKIARIGEIVLGFGILFVGLGIMSGALEPLRDNESFRNFLINFKNPVVGVLVGAVFTAIIQSSSASVGILQSFAAIGLIGLDTAVYVILGQNIGTCVTAIISAIGTSANSKRAAGIHLLFNIIGTIVYLILISLFPGLILLVESLSPGDGPRQIANFHTLFNITVTILLFPFARYLVKLITLIIPEKKTEQELEKKLIYLDERIAQTPAIALRQVLKETWRMGNMVKENMKLALEAFFETSEQKANRVLEAEDTIDYLCDGISRYLVEFRGYDLSEKDLRIMGSLHHVLIDLERIGDYAENIAEYAMEFPENIALLSPEGRAELGSMSEKTMETLNTGLDVFYARDADRVGDVEKLEQEVDDMKKTYISNHVDRLQKKACDPRLDVLYTNMVTTLERVSDHALNIAQSLGKEEEDE
ncbi:MAG: Na/Pi cotransporter family protein [Clostridiaceae bacterium]|jgi:phosphate:Na+ symporter|nr:Na/Pi cotransporter family protein [Clostridiaceae bacterium]